MVDERVERRARLEFPASATIVAPAFQGANTLDQACFAQPGEEMLRWTSPGLRPSPYMVDRWPIG